MTKKLIKEKDGIRGLVPSREAGAQDRAYAAYLNSLDPRNNEKLQIALASSDDPRFFEFLDRIMLERYSKVSLPTIAKACGIDLKEFNAFWQRASVQASIAIAQNRSVKITEDMALDAESREVTCQRCDGLKYIAATVGMPKETAGYRCINSKENIWIRDCPDCQNGKVRRPGDAHARDKILEMSGIIQRGKAAVSIVQNFGGASHSSAVSALDDAMTFDVTGE